MGLYGSHNARVSGLVNTERLLAEQMFSGFDDIHVQPLVQVMRNGAVDGVDGGRVQQVEIVLGGDLNALEMICEPLEHGRVGVANAGNTRDDVLIEQVAPARHGAAKFASHQATADNSEVDYTLLHDVFPN